MFYLITWMHTFADFFLQTRMMATNKSSSNKWLAIHIAAYTSPFLFLGVEYALLNGALHFVTDYISSRISGYFYKKGEIYLFFGTIGIDQALHFTCLWYTRDLITHTYGLAMS